MILESTSDYPLRIGLGTLSFAGPGGWGRAENREELIRVLRVAVDSGVTVIDTAWYYGPDLVLDLIREGLGSNTRGLLLTAKVGNTRDPVTHEYVPDVRPSRLREDCERTLQRLDRDCLPLLLLRWRADLDESSQFDDAWNEMICLKAAGKVERIGLSNVNVGLVRRACVGAEVAAISNAFNVLDQSDDHVLRYCEAEEIPFFAFYPLCRGDLTRLRELAKALPGRPYSAVQVAMLWLLGRSSNLIPIPGTSRLQHLKDNLEIATDPLDELSWIDLDCAVRKSLDGFGRA